VKKATKREFPQDTREQLLLSRNAVFNSWWAPKASYYRKMERISDSIGTACNIQAMVFGNMGDSCCTGVGFTRDPGTGAKTFYGEFLVNAQGEDVVAGIRTPSPISELEDWNADVYRQLREITASLEQHYKDMQDFEFTVQEGVLYMLQTRNGKRTGPAAVRVAVEMADEGLIDAKTAVGRVAPSQLDQLLHPVFDAASLKKLTKLATGIDASPGAAVGRLAFTSEDAVTMSVKGPVILIRKETTPDDIHGMDAAKGILTAVGGKSSHAAVGGARHGRSVRGGMRRDRDQRARQDRGGDSRRQADHDQGRRLGVARWRDRRSLSGTGADQGSGSELADFRPLHEDGGPVPRQVRRARQCRYPARCQGCARLRRRRHRTVSHRAYVLRGGSPAARAGDDSV
jgi:pyruvate,orthophosphate dikinase